jgi:hypothetical protein
MTNIEFIYLFCIFTVFGGNTSVWCLSRLTSLVSLIIFVYIEKFHPKVRAIDMRHILIFLPFLLDGLLADEISNTTNRLHPLNPALDPSSELIGITLSFIQWYNLYRRIYPPKDEVDIQDHTTLVKGVNLFDIFWLSCILNILCIF